MQSICAPRLLCQLLALDKVVEILKKTTPSLTRHRLRCSLGATKRSGAIPANSGLAGLVTP